MLMWLCISNAHSEDHFPSIEHILELPESEIDLGLATLIIEKQIHPNIDVQQGLEQINKIVTIIQKMPEYGPSSLERMGTTLRYFYTPSQWNEHQIYQYDLDDLTAQKNPLSTVSYLLENKYGNCLSLPTLVAIVGQRLGVDIKLAIAPSHVYAHYKDDEGNITNIEATSGTLLPNASYTRNFEIHPDALKNGIYMQSLSNKETIAVLLVELGRKHMRKQRYLSAYKVADLALKYHPKLARAMLLKGNVYYRQLHDELARLKNNQQPIGDEQRHYLDVLSNKNVAWFEMAESLGWREPAPDFAEKYKQSIERFKQNRQPY